MKEDTSFLVNTEIIQKFIQFDKNNNYTHTKIQKIKSINFIKADCF